MKYTEEQLQAARRYAAQTEIRIAEHVFDPDFGFAKHVTDLDKLKYANGCLMTADRILAGDLDRNFTIWQRMNYFLTGVTVPFLPK